MRRKKRKLMSDIMTITIVPLVILGIIVILTSSAVLYRGMCMEVQNSQAILTNSLCKRYENLYPGDYSLRDGLLYKGDFCLSEMEEDIDKLKKANGMDLTFIYGNTRYLTTILNADGTRANGTVVEKIVEFEVLHGGRPFFSDKLQVNGVSYFAYYIPLYNSNDTEVPVGMFFAGKPRREVIQKVMSNVLAVCLVECIVIALAIELAFFYSKKVIFSLEKTEKFLGEIAHGDLTAQIDPYLLERQDEIGEMGRFAVMLQQSITGLVGKDPLTGLANRRSCDVVMDSLMKKANQKDYVFTIVVGDIDFFKKVNDTYGHQAGDEVLKMVSQYIAEHMEHLGFAFRWGGEEFLMVYEDMDRVLACEHLKQLQQIISCARIFWNQEKIQITMTFGAADSLQEKDVEKIIQHADANVYIGKEGGRNCIVSL